MTDLRELEKRLEEATGGSEDLNIEILHVLHDHGGFAREMVVVPNFTGSLDAAVALVERMGFFYRLQKETPVGQKAFLEKYWATVGPAGAQEAANAETGPVALMLALIRALIAKGDRHD